MAKKNQDLELARKNEFPINILMLDDTLYNKFMVIKCDNGIFSGFDEENRNKPEGQRVLTEDNISLIKTITIVVSE
jgi:hypothetical protein